MTVTPQQDRFMRVHAFHLVTRWVWTFRGAMLRAFTESGEAASVTLSELEDLVDRGFVECFDVAGVRLTQTGRLALIRERMIA